MKTVAVVGGGPGGLVAAKTLLRSQPEAFRVTVFEKQERVGGMWAQKHDELYGGKCNPGMPANLSRFSVAFSDLAWESVDLSLTGGSDGKETPPKKLPLYPKAWQVGRYAEEYARRYIPKTSLLTSCQVTGARKVSHDKGDKWEVSWSKVDSSKRDASAGETSMTDVFDHLIVSPGFFNAARKPTFQAEPHTGVEIIHSSRFRTLQDVVPNPVPEGGKIVIVGGSMSGAEAAVSVAAALSDARHGLQNETVPPYTVHHVTARPFYDIPRLHAVPHHEVKSGENDCAPSFLPNDLSMFDLSKRPPGDITPSNGLVAPDKAKMTHDYLQAIIGSDQTDLAAPAPSTTSEGKSLPPFLAITDAYTEFVRSGDIVAVRGRATSVRPGSDSSTATVQVGTEKGAKSDLDYVVGIVNATGWEPHDGLRWLDPATRESMEEDVRSNRLPLLLHHHTTFHPSDTSIAFVGFHEGAFWAVMEMQAREVANRWNPNVKNKFPELSWKEEDMRALRFAMLNNEENVAQFWMGDYLANVDANARRQGIVRNDEGFGDRSGPVCAARYSTMEDDSAEVDKTLADLRGVLKNSTEGAQLVSRAIFRGLQGRWYINRELESALPSFPTGTFTGTACFHPRTPTQEGFTGEYLYVEEGELRTHAGLVIPASKRYVYRYSEDDDKISAWFVKADGRAVDYFFHDINIQTKKPRSHDKGWKGVGSHLCVQDNYDSSYEFRFRGAALQALSVQFVVKGPRKDYVSSTTFARPKNV